MAGKIFLNYRRADGGPWTLILCDKLIAHFGAERVFHDLSGVPLGARVRPYLAAQVADCAVMVTVIGPHWLAVLRERAAGPGPDHVLIEIETALQRGMAIIPVLAGGARMPAEAELPESIRDLADCAGTTLGLERLDADVAVLIAGLERVLATVAAERPFANSNVDMAAGGRPKLVATGHVFDKPSVVVNQAPLRAAEDAERQRAAEAAQANRKAEVEQAKRDGRFEVVLGDGKSDRTVWLMPGETAPRDTPFAPEMVLVPPGKVWMGSKEGEGFASECPRHEVTIGYPLLVGKYPVTFDEWDAYVTRASKVGFLGIGGSQPHQPSDQGWGRGRRPVIDVSWNDAQAHAAWLSKTTGKTYRLLTEAEWEYACRAGSETAYSFGNSITKQRAQFSEGDAGSAKQTVVVGQFSANAFGLHDMHGNVWEWCEDAWDHSYQSAPTDGSARKSLETSAYRVLRGGSWYYLPRYVRSAIRYGIAPDKSSADVGLRLARTV